MPSFTLVVDNVDQAKADHVNQYARAFSGDPAYGVPIALFVNDPGTYALLLKNVAPAGKALEVLDPDGTTVLLEVKNDYVGLKAPTIADFTNAQHTHSSAATGGILSSSWRDPVFLVQLA